MLVVRKEGKAHDRYNSFRSAFELLESVGREPQDCFDERKEDLPPLQKLERLIIKQHQESTKQHQESTKQHQESMKRLQSRVERLEAVGSEPQNCFDNKKEDVSPLQKLEQRMEQRMQQQQDLMQKQIDDLMAENEVLRSKINDVL